MKNVYDCTKSGLKWARKHVTKSIKGAEHDHRITVLQIAHIIADLCKRGKSKSEIEATLKAFKK